MDSYFLVNLLNSHERGPFSDTAIERLAEQVDMLAGLLVKHLLLMGDAPAAQRSGHEGSSERSRACETYSEHRGEHEAPRAPSQTSDGYSVAQDAYREELAFQRRRARRRRIGACLRVLAFIVLIPLGLAAVFVGSYVLTCIINGATPEEVLDVLAAMPSRVESFVRSVMAM